jgi:hypothetical protein
MDWIRQVSPWNNLWSSENTQACLDGRVATEEGKTNRLQQALEYYRLPNHLRQENPELPEYVRPVFRDMTDLEVGELSAQIHTGLERSHFLMVVCSPRAAASKWVNDEVEYYISLGKQDVSIR